MRAPAIAIVLCLWVNGLVQIDSLENQALTLVKRTPAYELDSVLPDIPVVSWFNQVVGPRAGVIWQLSECGKEATTTPKGDMPACLEANATLPDGHKVVMGILIGTFKKGLADKATFNFGVVEYEEQLRPAQKLSDLPRLLSSSRQPSWKNSVVLPDSVSDQTRIKWLSQPLPLPLPLPLGSFNKDWMTAELDPGQSSTQAEDVPPPPSQLRNSNSNQPQAIQRLLDKVLEGNAITRVEPIYPPTARALKAVGTVRVQITISETGRVIEARAISGHDALRSAAVEAARKWVFKPTTVNGAPIKVQGILNFTFQNNQ